MVWYVAAICAAGYTALVLDAFFHRLWILAAGQSMERAIMPPLLGLAVVAMIQQHILHRVRHLDVQEPDGE